MPKIARGRRVGQAAVNALRTLLEEHDHIVQEISGQNDFGEDFYVTFTDNGDVTSDTIKVQVKGGDSWRRGNGYAVPVDRHGDTWADGNIPVYCVVYDPATPALYWANATQQLRRLGPLNPPKYIGVSPNAVLDDITMGSFVAQARQYVGRYRGRQAVLTHLGEMSGAEFDPGDHVLHFVNGDDEDLIFWKAPGATVATLLLSAQSWDPVWVSLESLVRSALPAPEEGDDLGLPDSDLWTAEELGLSRTETMWVAACFMSTLQADEGPEDDLIRPAECEGCPNCTEEHGRIEANVIHEYVLARILDRLGSEPDLLQRSILAMREDTDLEPEIVAELGSLETEPRVVRQVNKLSHATVAAVDDIEPEAYRLAVMYLIRCIYVGSPSLPLDEQVRIDWRVPEPEASTSQGRST
ncbi:DUF4365 domain-containing protein [Streptomyces varsoviensis]|uniref:DUF4365 domain-containing protein n=1 Tax=Streptomyces varsoviensis TaxID=67373 RepID=A0ABR5JAT8_9ACTN|nr:DUF4365 domain-containing protein [Streptomyces varsoviensis]KOG90191.1 hypothetical protein ADK38_10085 [Streptomyces varsoviensis]